MHAWVKLTGTPVIGNTVRVTLAYEEYGAANIIRKSEATA